MQEKQMKSQNDSNLKNGNFEKLVKLVQHKNKLTALAGISEGDTLHVLFNILLITAKNLKVNESNFEKIVLSLSEITKGLDKLLVLALEKPISTANFRDMPRQVSIENFKDIQFPKQLSIERPDWYETFDKKWLSNEINNFSAVLLKGFEKLLQDVIIKNKEPKDAIPVRLVTAREKFPKFYNAHFSGGGGGFNISEDRLSYGKALTKITPIDVDDGDPVVYELPATAKYLAVQNKGSGIIAFGDADVTYDDYPTLTPRQFYEFIDCKKGFKVYFKCDTGKTAKIVGFIR